MELKPEIAVVLDGLGADKAEIDNLVAYFAAKLADAEAAVQTIEANIASLQKQLAEETARVERTRAGILKFVTTD